MEHSQSTGPGLLLAGRYRLGESIGRGGMGKVWRAHDEVLHRVVAVKELTAGRFVAEADRLVLHARTQKEARAAARITHPGVVTVHDVLEHDDRPWIVMQYVDGPSLADAVKEAGTVEPREAARVGLHVVGALRAAHAAGVLHRDVKPGNVLLARDGRVLITDFGIAAIEGDSTITRTGELVGSIDYLAPERVKGADPGPASDLWSLGATLYTAVEGTSPFRRTSPISTMQAVVGEEPPYPANAGPLAPVIVALLSKEPERRPQADEAERMLLEAMEGRSPQTAQAYVPTQRFDRREALEEGTAVAPVPAAVPATAPTASPAPAPVPVPAPVPIPVPEPGPSPTLASAAGPVAPVQGKGRWRTAVLTAVLAAVVAGGAVFAVMEYGNGRGGTDPDPRPTTAAPAPEPTGTGTTGTTGPDRGVAPGDAPEGWHRVDDPEGFSLAVPDGWKRQKDGDQIDYTPDNGRHRIRISIDRSPDFENPYVHALDLEKTLQNRMDYERVLLNQNTYRDQVKSAIWEFTWTEKQSFPGPRHAIDQLYYGDDGTEYAIYMSAPEESWEATREQFDVVLQHWRVPGE
ncbi:serine/threonine-protein kinase [Streptomyces termitum]|uniref:non-specific serine/threonine protein kinase n=1 Tax=Streptomyces termitum TaxID=67368 RepID=A0A918STF3_9ACTN|nr:serine/threonine-protein kinase [Streptomyces termitum]GHA66465.1 serine/threonine protein kinase [Streptomyces termitum]